VQARPGEDECVSQHCQPQVRRSIDEYALLAARLSVVCCRWDEVLELTFTTSAQDAKIVVEVFGSVRNLAPTVHSSDSAFTVRRTTAVLVA
jgi:hypothetical protein